MDTPRDYVIAMATHAGDCRTCEVRLPKILDALEEMQVALEACYDSLSDNPPSDLTRDEWRKARAMARACLTARHPSKEEAKP